MAQEREIRDLEFSEWRRGVKPEEISTIVPEVVRHVPRATEASLKVHFDEMIWPERRLALIGISENDRKQGRDAVAQSLEEASG